MMFKAILLFIVQHPGFLYNFSGTVSVFRQKTYEGNPNI